MASDRSCYVYVVLPGATEFTTAGRFRLRAGPGGATSGEFVYGRSYLERSEAVELDPVELRLADRLYLTGRMGGFFGAVRDSMPDYWGRLLIERRLGRSRLDEFDYLLEGPDDRAGALGFGPSVEPLSPRLRFAGRVALATLQAAADAMATAWAIMARSFDAALASTARARPALGPPRDAASACPSLSRANARFERSHDLAASPPLSPAASACMRSTSERTRASIGASR